MKEFYDEFHIESIDPDRLSSLDLAYVGDSAYELTIRTFLLAEGPVPVDKLNRRASNFAKAATQARMITELMEELTPEEQAIYRRGRNAKSYSPSKSSTLGDYHRATGFEAVIGWLFLKRAYARMFELIRLGWEKLEKEKETKTDPEEVPEGGKDE